MTPLTTEQLDILKGYIVSHEDGIATIEQIHYLAGGQVSGPDLTIVCVQEIQGKVYRYVDEISPEGRTTSKEAELQANPFKVYAHPVFAAFSEETRASLARNTPVA